MTLTDPAEILALAGLELPPGAHNIRVTTKPNLIDKGYIYAYTVTWDGTVETTIAFLATIGYDLNLLGPRDDSDLETVLNEMSLTTVPKGSLGTSWSFQPQRGYGSGAVLVEGPDFTTVHVSVASFPS